MCLEEVGGGDREEVLGRLQQQQRMQQQKLYPAPLTKDMLKGAVFAQSLQKRLRKLQQRRTSEPSELTAEDPAAGGGGAVKDDLFALPGHGDEEEKVGMSFMLGRFLSGSDPSLCSTAMSNYSSGRSSGGGSVEEEDGGNALDPLDSVVGEMDDVEEKGQEDGTLSKEKSKLLGSVSSGFCSEPDGLSALESGDYLEPQQWVSKHFDGSNCSLDDDAGSGISTPIATNTAAAAFVRESSPAFESCVTDDDGVLSSTPRADDYYMSAAFAPVARKEEAKREETPEKDPGFLTITSGEEKHQVAKTKLNALISLLESSSPGSSMKRSSLKKGKDEKRFDSAPDLTARDFSTGHGAPIDIVIGDDMDGPRSLIMDEELRAQKPSKMRRASSLKTGKTPPGTPGTRKIVR